MKKMIMSETAAAYGVVVMLVLFALMTSCSGPAQVSYGYKNPKPLHRTTANTHWGNFGCY